MIEFNFDSKKESSPIYHDIEQQTDIWYQLKIPCYVTSSSIACVMSNIGKPFGLIAKKYAVTVALQQINGVYNKDTYTNQYMRDGIEKEPIANELYQEINFCELNNGGFFVNGLYGDSPDALIGDDGVLEIKCVIPSVMFEYVSKKYLPSTYKWQCLWHLFITERKYLDFVAYCDKFPPGRQLLEIRIYASDYQEEFKLMEGRSKEFVAYVDSVKDLIMNSNYYHKPKEGA